MLVIAGLLAVGGCGGGDDDQPADRVRQGTGAATQTSDGPTTEPSRPARTPASAGRTVTVGESEFGTMLFDSDRRAIYIFERDPKGKSVCYGECAEAWPPVLTNGEPVAGKGVAASRLGTVKRRDGRLQVTYAGKPLYLYAHEQPGEVRCHDVRLNGGFWWVVGPDGRRRP